MIGYTHSEELPVRISDYNTMTMFNKHQQHYVIHNSSLLLINRFLSFAVYSKFVISLGKTHACIILQEAIQIEMLYIYNNYGLSLVT